MKSNLRLVSLTHENQTVATPLRQKDDRSRKHLLPQEVDALVEAARKNRHGHRDGLMVLMTYRHGLRSAELVTLRWDQIDFKAGTIHINRVKNGVSSTHPLQADTMRALRKLQRDQQPVSPFIFTSERAAPFSTAGFQKMIERAGIEAELTIKPHAHMLRHACGYALANRGIDTRSIQAFLGHVSIEHTARYTALASNRFKDFWR
jgi:type 1 fimbriae regulatory protein FimB/type 1 fimbriae regulatory protein FimE